MKENVIKTIRQLADLTRGYERADALMKNIEGIIEKINQMQEYRLDISYYEQKFEEYKREFEREDSFLQNTKLFSDTVQKDFEHLTLSECNKKFEDLIIDFEENITPVYNIYALFNSINQKINDIENDNLEEITSYTIKLIDQINSINTHNKIDVKILLYSAYTTIYQALLYESVYAKTTILDYLNRKDLSTNRESLGQIIRIKIKKLIANGKLNNDDLNEETIKHLNEGLGYDYISSEFISILSKKSLAAHHHQLKVKKERIKSELGTEVVSCNNKYHSLVNQITSNKKELGRLTKVKLCAAALSIALVITPIVSTTLGYHIGKTKSDKILEYATTTRNVNLNTGNVIGEPTIVFDENPTTYVASVTIYEPWRNNPTGVGYIRNATTYEYIVPDNISEDYHISIEDIKGNLKEKYTFHEQKDILEESENMTDSSIIITETFQDKTINRKSKKFIIPFSLLGLTLGAAIDILAFFLLEKRLNTNDSMRRINQKIKISKANKKELNEEMSKLEKEAIEIKDEIIKISDKYGIEIDKQLFIDTLSISQTNKPYIKTLTKE